MVAVLLGAAMCSWSAAVASTPASEDGSAARLIFLWPEEGQQASAGIHVFVNGKYHVSLSPGMASQEIALCPVRARIRLVPALVPGAKSQAATAVIDARQNEAYFIQIGQKEDGNLVIDSLNDLDRAEEMAKSLAVQTRGVSRFFSGC